MKIQSLIILFALSLFACKNLSHQSPKEDPFLDPQKGLQNLSVENYQFGKYLLGKKGSLTGVSSLNIKGNRSYKFDERENITAIYDMTNNYTVYTYDERSRLVKFEIRQHTPAETYHEVIYTYTPSDSVKEIKKSHLENGLMKITEIKDEGMSLDHMGVKELYFQDKDLNQLYLDEENREIITYKNDMVFCCGVRMKGKNKLNYYLNENGRIDSLVIRSLEEEDQMKFEYEYE